MRQLARNGRWLRAAAGIAALAIAAPRGGRAADFVAFESGPVRPLALSADGARLFVANTPDDRLEIFDVTDSGLAHRGSVAVGLEPVAVAARTDSEVWVVNHLSDSVSIVDVGAEPPRVVRTLLVGDEPGDIVFAGRDHDRAFIAAAHRGQNVPFDPQPFTPGLGRADVWVFDAKNLGTSLGGDPLAIVTVFGDTPRALAATPDGRTVYAAVLQSGNQTTIIPGEAVCDGGAAASPCAVDGLSMPGGLPAPNANLDGVPGPEVGLIAKFNRATGAWEDELGRNWNNAARFALPDKDVFAIDAVADPPRESQAFSGVGTVLYAMAVNPVSGAVYVANTEARNEVRLEPRVQGHLHESRLTILADGAVAPRHLNKHIDYDLVPSPPGVRERSLALPVGLAVSGDGATLYVAAFGSSAVGVFSTAALADDSFVPDAADHIPVRGGGPVGPVLDEGRQRLYLLTRFDDAVAVIDLETRREVAHLPLFNPEPASVTEGRPYLYDAVQTSSNGEAACAACHVFADFDGLAWDLGTPDGPVVNNPLPLKNVGPGTQISKDFHPLKGPMTTQTLRGMATHGSMHWRGDRTAGNDPGGSPLDAHGAFLKFEPAFATLMGREAPLPPAPMEALAAFVLQITPPPNPYRQLDNSLTQAQQTARDRFIDGDCAECHIFNPAAGSFGTAGFSATNGVFPQFMKVPHLRNVYQKIGRFFGVLFHPLIDPGFAGDQIRGYGYSHDGSGGRTQDPADEFLLVFDSNLAPIVGQQITLSAASAATAAARVDLLTARAAAGECDLIAKGVVQGEARGWYRTSAGTFAADRRAEAALSDAALGALAMNSEGGVTYTCVPSGSGERLGVDRDRDGAYDRDEVDVGADPANSASVPLSRAHLLVGVAGSGGILILRALVEVPALTDTFDPSAQGLRIAIVAHDGAALASRDVPPGRSSGTASAGWTVNQSGTLWRYRAAGGQQAGGISRVIVADRSRPGLRRFLIRIYAIGGELGLPAAESLPVRLRLTVGNADACGDGPCPTLALAGSGLLTTCRASADGIAACR